VPSVTGGFFKQMHQYPAKVYWRFVTRILATLIKGLSLPHDGISARPSLPIGGDSRLHGVSWTYLVILDDGILTGEALE
jgi:hypothetical protein